MSQDFQELVSGETTFGELYGIINGSQAALRTWFIGTEFPPNPLPGQPCIRSNYTPWRIFIYTEGGWVDITDFMPAFVALGEEVGLARGTAQTLRAFLLMAHNADGSLKSDAPAGTWWTDDDSFVERISNNSFTTGGDKTHIYAERRAIQVTQSGVDFGYIIESSYSVGEDITTVTVAAVELTAEMTAVAYGQETENTPRLDYADVSEALAGESPSALMTPDLTLTVIAASLPGTYSRDQVWSGGGSGSAEARRTIVTPGRMALYINGSGYVLGAGQELDINVEAAWDNADYATPANRAGKDFYAYACTPESGRTPDILLSADGSCPAGKTTENSRLIAGFHCLCANVGTIADHWLTGYVAGDILPASLWDLLHRPRFGIPTGMVYSPSGHWVDIYLSSIDSGQLASISGAAFVTGDTAVKFHWYKFSQWLGRIGKRMPTQTEFQALSIGSNQGTNIAGSANPVTTGGHSDTAGRRMISNIGCEDCCGVLWQWGDESGAGGTAAWANAYDANDAGVAGQHHTAPNRPLFGGGWAAGAYCGSRGAGWSDGPLYLRANGGVRGVAEPL